LYPPIPDEPLPMRVATVLFLTLYLLRVLVAELNHTLSGVHVWIFAGGLFIAYSALMLPFRQGFGASLLAGLLCDSLAPVAFGTHTALFALSHAVVYNVRERMQRDETAVRVSVALIVNLALFVILTLARIRHTPGGPAAWPRILSDLVCSQVAIALIGPWFFAFQFRTLELAGASPSRAA
jgi:rod shape-determining protein MreD